MSGAVQAPACRGSAAPGGGRVVVARGACKPTSRARLQALSKHLLAAESASSGGEPFGFESSGPLSAEVRHAKRETLRAEARQILLDSAAKVSSLLGERAKRLQFHLPPAATSFASLPYILFLGNASAGKSTLINHLLDRQCKEGQQYNPVQNQDPAPLDDKFSTLPTCGEHGGGFFI